MENLVKVIGSNLNQSIGKHLGIEYKTQVLFLDGNQYYFVLLPEILDGTAMTYFKFRLFKRDTSRYKEICRSLNDNIKNAMNESCSMVESTLMLRICDQFKIHCAFNVNYKEADSAILFQMDF